MELVQQPDNECYIIDRNKSLMSNETFEDIFKAVNDFTNNESFNYITNCLPSGAYSVDYPYVYSAKDELDGTILCEFETIADIGTKLPELLI